MTIQSLEYRSVDEAMAFIPQGPSIAISILTPGRDPAPLHPDLTAILRLYFSDDTPREGATQNGPNLFTTDHAWQVINFIRQHHQSTEDKHLLIHCEAGISRSAAVAVFTASECRLPLTGQFAFLNPWVLQTLVRAAYPHYAF